MRFRPDAKLDPSQVTDVRGRRVGGPVLAGGGGVGVVGLVIFVLYVVLGGNGGDLGALGSLDGQSVSTGRRRHSGRTARPGRTPTAARTAGSWPTSTASRATGPGRCEATRRRRPSSTRTRSRPGCGYASSQVGPFYCPADKQVYIDLGFFDELQSRFGAEGGPFAEAYVLAHEYGHHIQDLLGTLGRASREAAPRAARCGRSCRPTATRGVWAKHAVETGLIEQLTQADINAGSTRPARSGTIASRNATQGQVNPETWTHGSSEQRRRWFSKGYETGRPAACDTFTGSI